MQRKRPAVYDVYEEAADKTLAGLSAAMQAAGLPTRDYGGGGRQVWHEQRMAEERAAGKTSPEEERSSDYVAFSPLGDQPPATSA